MLLFLFLQSSYLLYLPVFLLHSHLCKSHNTDFLFCSAELQNCQNLLLPGFDASGLQKDCLERECLHLETDPHAAYDIPRSHAEPCDDT